MKNLEHKFYTYEEAKELKENWILEEMEFGGKVCKVCEGILDKGGSGSSLTTHCISRTLNGCEAEAIREEDLDFVDGKWIITEDLYYSFWLTYVKLLYAEKGLTLPEDDDDEFDPWFHCFENGYTPKEAFDLYQNDTE